LRVILKFQFVLMVILEMLVLVLHYFLFHLLQLLLGMLLLHKLKMMNKFLNPLLRLLQLHQRILHHPLLLHKQLI
jgi:hypothetical protein